MSEINKYSKTVTQDTTQPAAQAMLHAIGLTDEDVGIFVNQKYKKHIDNEEDD